ncbi:GreA/GreB family elongation factor [Rubrolithibacter danxiaensis]|uniref:GreA/GreB family elongation factor n=1 Tax=Rubrolithibacter danxiaensis TaxID=3390805 RepID=UPI003BF86BF4
MKAEKLIILKRELDLLKTHLMHSDLSDFNKQKLLEELKSAQIMKDDELPDDVVCLDSQVEIRETTSGQLNTFQIVLPSEANIMKKKVSVFAPIGVALLGYRVGAKVQWEMPTGMKTFEILKVIPKKVTQVSNLENLAENAI